MGGFMKDFLFGTQGAAEKKNEANAAALMSTLGTQYGYGEAQLLQGIAGLETGFSNAAGILSQQGLTATNQILATQKQTLGKNAQGLISSGLFNTTMGANLAQQAQAQTNQSLTGLAEGLGAQQAGLEVQGAQAKNAALQSLGQYAMNKVSVQKAITPQYTGSGGAMGSILGAVGAAFGGPLGAAAGAGLAGLFSGGETSK
jgi:hypothetical protein